MGQSWCKSLSGPHDETGVHASPAVATSAAEVPFDPRFGSPRVLVDLDPESFIYFSQTSYQPGRVKARAVRRIRRTEGAGDLSAVAGFTRVEPDKVLRGVAQFSGVAHVLLQSTCLKFAAREVESATAHEVGVDVVAGNCLA